MNHCESCGMPLNDKFVSKLSNVYCIYCQNQETGELSTFEQVRTGCVKAAIKLLGKTPKEAEKIADESLPKLPRWKKQN